jgi:ribosomal-protein-alanine N-acetyltransferase
MQLSALIRRLESPDIPGVLEIQSASLEASRWTSADYARACDASLHGLVAVSGESLGGFLVSRFAADEMEILNLAVLPALRRHGLATQLLAAALDHARSRGAKKSFLEVRYANTAAIAFYLRHGFTQSGRRPGYYSDPSADALLLSRPL